MMRHLSPRFDFTVFSRFIEPNAKVLDLGCGDGMLLQYLQQHNKIRGYGIERDPVHVVNCISNGINVLQLDLEQGLRGFPDNTFDAVIMSLSLQVVHNTELLIREMLRVGSQAIVSFPNFAYKHHRAAIAAGRMPVSKHLPYQWYNSPNIRFFTIDDFVELCATLDINILELLAFDDGRLITDNPNLEADVALVRLGRNP